MTRTIDISDYVTLPPNNETIVFKHGDTDDIIAVIQKMDAICSEKRFLKDFAPQLEGATTEETLKNVFYCAKQNFQYAIDAPGKEKIKSPAWMLYYRVGDCKSYSVFIADCLRELQISCVFRFVGFDATDKTPTHVFVVATVGTKKYTLDAISRDLDFNEQAPGIKFRKDIKIS